jgi:hypothetical protein
MSATQAFADAWRRSGRAEATLVQIDLLAAVDPALTIYASHKLVSTPNGVLWEPLIEDITPINAPGAFGSFDIPLCSTTITLNRKKVSSQSGSFTDLLHGHAVIGSVVTIYLWELGIASWLDVLRVFRGTIQDYEVKSDAVVLNVRQRTDWNRAVCPSVDPSAYPRAPEKSRGVPQPVVYGKAIGPGLRLPHTPDYSVTQRRLEMLRGPRQLTRGLIVDHGRGGTAKPKVLAASHKVFNLSDPTKGTGLWADVNGKMALVNAQPADAFSADSGSGILLVDDQDAFVMADLGDVVSGVTNPAHNARYVLEPSDATFTELDYDQLQRDLQVRMASMPDLGSVASITALVVYEAISGTALRFQAIPLSGAPTEVALAATTVPTLATNPATPAFGAWGDLSDYTLRVYFNAASAGNYVKVYFFGLLVAFNMRRTIVVGGHKVTSNRKRPTFRGETPVMMAKVWGSYSIYDDIPDVTELTGDYYWSVQGQVDTLGVTGVFDSLLEQAPHLYADILARYGGQTIGSQIESGATTFGSYTEATAFFKSWINKIMPFGFFASETDDVMTVLSWLSSSTLSFIYLDRLTDRFHIIPWDIARPVDWFFAFTPREINELAPECRMTPEVSVVTAVRLSYGWNAKNGGFEHEASIGPNHSSAGQRYVGLRDESLVVVANVNDRINFVAGGTTLVVTLLQSSIDALIAAGVTPAGALAFHAQTVMNGTDADANREYYCQYAGTVTAGHNDRLTIIDTITRSISLIPGTYTMEAQAAMAQAAIVTAGGTLWTVSYSRTTGKFTFARSSGTCQLGFAGGTNQARNAAALFGFAPLTKTGAQSYTGEVAIEEERFAFAVNHVPTAVQLDLRWATGADGSEAATPRTAASLFGFDPRFDNGRNNAQIHVGICPKGTRESTLARAVTLYGAKREPTFEGRFIYDGEVARETRNRLVGLFAKPRLNVEFTTEHAPDLERGRVIAFSGDFDAALAYPEPGTDGSWAGKRFMVVETEQMLGPGSYSTRIVATSLG